MNEIERYRPGRAGARPVSVPTRVLPRVRDDGPTYGEKLHPAVTGTQVWSARNGYKMRRRLTKALRRGEVAGAYYMPDRGDGWVYAEVQLMPRRPRNWAKIGVLSALAVAGAGGAVALMWWVMKLLAAAAAGASIGGVMVLLLLGALVLAAGGGTVTVTTVTTIRKSLF